MYSLVVIGWLEEFFSLTELLMEKDILDRSFARFGYAGLDKCTHWLLLVG